MSSEYTIIITDNTFKLSQLQIEFDSPNLFTSYFIRPAGQKAPRQLEVSRDPYLFTIILRYLNGYQVLPLHPGLIPPYCTLEAALADLVADARFYKLNGLLKLLTSNKNQEDQGDGTIIRYAKIVGDYMTKPNQFEPTQDFSAVVPNFTLELSSEEQCQMFSKQSNFRAVPKTKDGGSADIFYVCFLYERIIHEVLQRDGYALHVDHCEQLGWIRSFSSEYHRQCTILVKLWTGPGFKAD